MLSPSITPPRVGCWEGTAKGYWWQLVSLGGVRWGAAGRAGLLSRGPGGESLALAPSPLVFGRCELLPRPHAQVEEPSRGLFVSPLTFPFLERKGKSRGDTERGRVPRGGRQEGPRGSRGLASTLPVGGRGGGGGQDAGWAPSLTLSAPSSPGHGQQHSPLLLGSFCRRGCKILGLRTRASRRWVGAFTPPASLRDPLLPL